MEKRLASRDKKKELYEMISAPDWIYLTQTKDYNYKFCQQL